MPAIEFGKTTIPFTIKRSNRRKTIAISVDSNEVVVTAPTETTEEKIYAVMNSKAVWIRKQLLHYGEMTNTVHHRLFLSGEKLPYLGRQYRLKILKGSTTENASFKFSQGRFIAYVPEEVPKEQYRDVLMPLYEEWVKEKGTVFVKGRITRFTQKLQAEPTAIKLKDQQQRWGSCTTSGQLLINWRTMLAPVSVIDYVIAHELTHLKHMDHSKAFWDTLKMVYPDYEEKKEWLRVNGTTLYI